MPRLWACVVLLGCATAIPEFEDAGGVDSGAGPTPDARMFAYDSAAPLDTAPPPPDAAPCVGGTAQVVGPEGACYLFFNDNQTWANARASCEALVPPAHLATIVTTEENALLAPYLGTADWYIGLTDADLEGVFRWSTGETLAYSNWRSGEPNNSGGNEDCAVLEGHTGALWDDRPCGLAYLRVCERD